MTTSIIAAMVIIFLIVTFHFTALKMISRIVRQETFHPSLRVVSAVYLIALTHFAEVVLFGIGYYVAVTYLDAGSLSGEFQGSFREYIYFSLVTYTSLGIGDIFPQGPIRLIAGLEALTGLLMIGWSASFTYICMTKLWDDEEA